MEKKVTRLDQIRERVKDPFFWDVCKVDDCTAPSPKGMCSACKRVTYLYQSLCYLLSRLESAEKVVEAAKTAKNILSKEPVGSCGGFAKATLTAALSAHREDSE